MTEAKKVIEELKTKCDQLEARDKEVTRCHEMIRKTQTQSDAWKTELEQARQSGTLSVVMCCAWNKTRFKLFPILTKSSDNITLRLQSLVEV